MSVNTTIAAGSIPLLERETELAALKSALARAAAGAGGVVLIDGVPGVGKSRLLASARSQARDLGLRVLEARGAVIERRFAFGVVRQLFEPVVLALKAEDRAPLFSGAAALAGSVLSETAAAPPAAGDAEFGILNGLYWLTVNLSDGGPLLLAVDDAHWADAPSLRFLGYLSRRLEGLPVLVAATGRSADSEGDELWSALAGDRVAEVLRPNPLSDSASAELVRSRLRADADPRFCAACHRATAGNPLFLGELLAALSSAGVEPSADAAAAVTDLGPGAVARFVLHRLERLGPAATALAQALAVFGDEVDVPLAAQAAGLELDAARVAADSMVQADVLAPDQLLRFVHPVVQTAVYENLLPGDRAARHGAVARLLEQAQARPEQIAAHVLRARPEGDAGWVDDLRAAAAKASERGDPLGATTWLRRALEEPPGDDAAAEILCELGNLEVGIREHEQARDHLLAVLESSPRPDLRTRAGVWLARSALIWGKAQAASEALEVLLAELERTQGEDRLELEAEILILTRIELS